MPRIAIAIVASALAFCGSAQAQMTAVTAGAAEAVVTVIKVNHKARTATIRGPDGRTVDVNVPPEMQNFDQVKAGSAFKVRYVESIAISLQRGGKASATATQSVRLAPKGGNPGGVVTTTHELSATVEAVDYASRVVALKGPKGNVRSVRVADDVKDFATIKVGDRVTVTYTEAVAMEMIPQARK